MNNMLIDYGWSSPFQDYLPQDEVYTQEIFVDDDQVEVGGDFAQFTAHGKIEMRIMGKSWFNAIGGESVEPLGQRSFQSVLGHTYYDVLNASFIYGDGSIITVTNNTEEDHDMAVYDLTIIGMDSLTLEEAGEIFIYEKDVRGISADISVSTEGSGKSSAFTVATETEDAMYLNSIPESEISDEIHIGRSGSCALIKRVGEERDISGGSLVDFEDMPEGGQYIAYLLSGAHQSGIKGDVLEDDAIAIHYELAEAEEITAQYQGEVLSFGPGTSMTIDVDAPNGPAPDILYSAPIDSNLMDGLEEVSSLVMFRSKGELYNKNTFLTNEKQYEIRATFINQNLDNGLVLWYNKEIGKVKFTVNDKQSKAEILTGETSNVRKTITKSHTETGLTYPSLGEDILVSARINSNNIKFYINGTEVISMEQRSFQQGYFGIHGDQGAVCSNFSIESPLANNWDAFATNSCMVDLLENSFVIKAEAGSAYIEQSLLVEAGKDYTLSFYYTGDVTATIRNLLGTLHTMTFSSIGKERATMTFSPAEASEITIEIGSFNANATIEKPMFEERAFATTYTPTQRDLSKLTFPADRLDLTRGGIAIAFSPMYSYGASATDIPVFHYSDEFYIKYSMGKVVAKYGQALNEVSFSLDYDEKYCAYLVWDAADKMTLGVTTFDGLSSGFNDVSISEEPLEESSFFYVGSSTEAAANILIDALAICDEAVEMTSLEEMVLTRSTLQTLYDRLEASASQEEADSLKKKISDFSSIIIRTGFEKESLVYDSSKISIPAPKAGSNIIVEAADGTIYDRVCFINDNNDYDLYHRERIFYYGDEEFELSFGNILDSTIEIFIDENGMILEDVETEDIIIMDINEKGETVNSVDTGRSIARIKGFEYYNVFTQTLEVQGEFIDSEGLPLDGITFESKISGNFNHLKLIDVETKKKVDIPYEYLSFTSDGYFVHMAQSFIDSLDDINNYYLIDDYLYGEPFEFRYVVKDTFCLNYDREHDQYDLRLSNIGSENVSIIYEEEAGLDKKVIRTVEINPFKSTANSGFVYIKDKPIPLETFDIKITPDSIMANGYEEATLVIDCLGRGGHPTSYVDLDLVSRYKLGTITRYQDPNDGEITDEHRAGRFIYKYRANPISEYEKTDKIIIKDKVSKIGIQIPIRLVRE